MVLPRCGVGISVFLVRVCGCVCVRAMESCLSLVQLSSETKDVWSNKSTIHVATLKYNDITTSDKTKC